MAPIGQHVLLVPVQDDLDKVVKLVTSIKKLGATTFEGGTNYLNTAKWLEDMKSYFDILTCIEIEKKKVAAFLLTVEAKQWWQSVQRSRDVTLMDWTEFQRVFLEKYFPAATRSQPEREFLDLK